MHECNFEQTNFTNGVIQYYCKGCKKGWFSYWLADTVKELKQKILH